MNERYMYITIDVSEANDYRGKWVATVVKTEDVDQGDESALNAQTGVGDTPLEAAANLLALAVAMQQRRQP